MIDRDGLFSPNAASRGEPDREKLVYLSLRRNGMLGDVGARTLDEISFYASLSFEPIKVAVRKSVKYDCATIGFGVTKEGLPFALLVPMTSLLSRKGRLDCSVRPVTMAVYWECVSSGAIAEFSAGIPVSDEWKADFPLTDEEGNLLESGRLRVYAGGDIILANGFDGECPCGFVSSEGWFGDGSELSDSYFVDGGAFKVYSDKHEYRASLTDGIARLSSYLSSSVAARNRLTGADSCVYKIVASKTAPILVAGFNSSNNGVCTVSGCADWIEARENSLYNANIKVLDMQKSVVKFVQIYESRGFIIAVPSEVDFQCSENVRKYFIGVRFSSEMRELLCALPSVSLTYVNDKITLGFDRDVGSVSHVNGFHNSLLFNGGVLEIPSEIECIRESKAGFDYYFKVNRLVIKSPLEVGKKAFLGAEIEEIVGSENLTKVGEAAFANSSLKSLALGDKARLSELSFDGCSGLMSITGVERAKAISMSAFAGCYNINEEVRKALRVRGVYTDKLTLTHRLSDSAYKKFRSFCSGVSLTPSECVYLNEFIQKGVSKEEVSRVRDALRGKPADFKQLNALYIYYDRLVDVYTKGILSGIVEFGDHERTVYKFRKEFGILVLGYE